MPANGGGGGGGQGPMGGLRSEPGRLSLLAVVPETDPFRYPGGRAGARLQLGGCARGAGGKAGQVRGPEGSWPGAGPQVRGRGRGGVLAGTSSGYLAGGRTRPGALGRRAGPERARILRVHEGQIAPRAAHSAHPFGLGLLPFPQLNKLI